MANGRPHGGQLDLASSCHCSTIPSQSTSVASSFSASSSLTSSASSSTSPVSSPYTSFHASPTGSTDSISFSKSSLLTSFICTSSTVDPTISTFYSFSTSIFT
mmetsp:Transcript_14726/g.20332  ORF Transcript_14726/g.20332 Transcript_14726/m.20332 type:complete len:103 (+) Transcript_14726:167-475(+)